MMGSYLKVLPILTLHSFTILTLHSFTVTLFTLGLRLFYPVPNKQQSSSTSEHILTHHTRKHLVYYLTRRYISLVADLARGWVWLR